MTARLPNLSPPALLSIVLLTSLCWLPPTASAQLPNRFVFQQHGARKAETKAPPARQPLLPIGHGRSPQTIGLERGAGQGGQPALSSYPRDKLPPPLPAYPRDNDIKAPANDAAGQGRGASAQAATASAPQSSAELIAAVIARLESFGTVAFKLHQEITLFDERLVGAGNYLQVAHGDRLWRLEVVLKGENDTALLQQVCDGRYLWIHERNGAAQQLRKIDLLQVNQVAQAQRDAGGPLLNWGTGGLAQLIRGLGESFEFGGIEETVWQAKPAYRVSGRWRPALLAELLPEQKDKIRAGQGGDLSRLARHVPDQAVLYVSSEDLLPLRVEYLRHEKPAWYARLWSSAADRAITSIEFFDYKLDQPIDERHFTFPSGNIEAVDGTDAYLARLKQAAQLTK